MTKANGATEAKTDLVKVRLLYAYVPQDAEYDIPQDEPGTKIFRKRFPEEVIELPKAEAQALVDADKAKAVF